MESVRVDERGRVQFSAGMRKRAGLQPGDELLVWEEAPGVFRVQTRRAAAQSLLGMAGAAGSGALDDLRAMRAADLAREDELVRRAASAMG